MTRALLPIAALAALAVAGTGIAQMAQRSAIDGEAAPRTGEDVYRQICQACHMPDARGAQGAAIRGYPALAGNPRLASAAYAAMVVVRGQKAMPAFAELSDAQVAAVVNYLRSNFGNRYGDTISAEQVRPLRLPGATRNDKPPG
jgi:mono/diheme cytochrome c family protein